MTRTRTLTLAAMLLSSPATAWAGDHDPLRIDVASGVGVDYGVVGVSTGLDLRGKRGMGVSAAVGIGAGVSGSAYLWSPGQHVRLGLGAAAWHSWAALGGSGGPQTEQVPRPHPAAEYEEDYPVDGGPGPGAYPGPEGCYHCQRNGAWAATAQIALDHDFGRKERLGIRYGLGIGVVGAGCAAAFVPAPSIGLRYAF